MPIHPGLGNGSKTLTERDNNWATSHDNFLSAVMHQKYDLDPLQQQTPPNTWSARKLGALSQNIPIEKGGPTNTHDEYALATVIPSTYKRAVRRLRPVGWPPLATPG
jgi:hypothetical protein